MAVFGKVEMQLDRFGGTIFTGIGAFGSRREFEWKYVSSIYENQISHKRRGNKNTKIVLVGKKSFSFGLSLSDKRRKYLFQSFEIILSMQKANKRFV
jgi:hypothetical protein